MTMILQDHRRLGVREPPQLDEQLGRDSGRGNAQRSGDDQGLGRPPSQGQAEHQPRRDVQADVGARGDEQPPTAGEHLLDRELDPEVEHSSTRPSEASSWRSSGDSMRTGPGVPGRTGFGGHVARHGGQSNRRRPGDQSGDEYQSAEAEQFSVHGQSPWSTRGLPVEAHASKNRASQHGAHLACLLLVQFDHDRIR